MAEVAAAAAAKTALSLAKTAILDVAPKILKALNAIRSASWTQEGLPQQLEDISRLVQQIQDKIESGRLPTTRQGRSALVYLHVELEAAHVKLEEWTAWLHNRSSSNMPNQQGDSERLLQNHGIKPAVTESTFQSLHLPLVPLAQWSESCTPAYLSRYQMLHRETLYTLSR